MQARILILFAHPRPDRSEVQAALLEGVRDLPDVTARDLYALYPGFEIDVDREQELLRQHEVIVLQHPVYWYSCPALLKEWQDLVLEYGFAYGSEGEALKGKILLNAVSCGGRREVYRRDGANRNELRTLFSPFEQTALLCGMRYLPPYSVFAAGHAREEKRLEGHVAEYRHLLQALSAGRVDLERAEELQTLSDDLAFVIQQGDSA